MKDAQPKAIYLKDYRSPAYEIQTTDLTFELAEEFTLVTSKLSIKKVRDETLVLNGQHLELVSVCVDDEELSENQFKVTAEHLELEKLPDAFLLTVTTKIKPQDNTALEGLYKSSDMYCTQCEAEGFRRITYYLDRPDVMSVFTTTIIADKKSYPVLLSNGNLIESEDLSDGKHKTVWHDPHKKPCYLFALVAYFKSIEDEVQVIVKHLILSASVLFALSVLICFLGTLFTKRCAYFFWQLRPVGFFDRLSSPGIQASQKRLFQRHGFSLINEFQY